MRLGRPVSLCSTSGTTGRVAGEPNPATVRPRRELRVPPSLEFAAAISWRLLIIGAAAIVSVVLLARLQVILVAVAVAILLACALWPAVARLRHAGVPDSLAALAVLVALVGSFALVGWIVAPVAADDVRSLELDGGGYDGIEAWLVDGPLALSESQAERYVDRVEVEVRRASNRIVRGAWGQAMIAVEIAAGIILSLVLAFFFLKDGDRMWRWVRGFVPSRRSQAWDTVSLDVRDVLAGFLRGTTIVAAVDAVGIGLGVYLLGVPLALPIAILTFIGGFIPLVGATVAGLVAVGVALASEGPYVALAVLAVVIGVQQLEGNVVQPFVVGRSVKLHPAVVLLAVGAGAVLWGIAGALLAVPATAALATVVEHLRRGAGETPPPPEPDSVLETA